MVPTTTNHQEKLSGYIEELLDKFDAADVSLHFSYSVISIHYLLPLSVLHLEEPNTLPTGDTEAVFAFRYENVNKPLSFSKKELVNSVAFGQLGLSNRRKQIGTSRDKCTLIFLRCLSEELRSKVIRGIKCHGMIILIH